MIHGHYVEIQPVILKYRKKGINIYYFCGGRGIGKTYGAIDMAYQVGMGELMLSDIEDDNKVLFLRRTAVEAEAISRAEKSFFKKYNQNEHKDISTDYHAKLNIGTFYNNIDKERKLGYIAGLSTFSNSRGVDFSDVILIIYDECIPESENKATIKNEGFLLLNAIETINRNRLQEGKPEVILVMMSNPIDLGNGLLAQLDITRILNHMIFSNLQSYTEPKRSLHIEKYKDHVVSKEKENSILYKFASTTGFNERALSGDFVDNDLSLIKNVPLKEYSAFLSLEQVCVYKHKSTGALHLSTSMSPAKYKFRAADRETVRQLFIWNYKIMVLDKKVTYDSFSTKIVFESMIGYKPILS